MAVALIIADHAHLLNVPRTSPSSSANLHMVTWPRRSSNRATTWNHQRRLLLFLAIDFLRFNDTRDKCRTGGKPSARYPRITAYVSELRRRAPAVQEQKYLIVILSTRSTSSREYQAPRNPSYTLTGSAPKDLLLRI